MKRLVVVSGITLAAFIYSYLLLSSRPFGAGDLTWQLGGASALVHGINPYANPLFDVHKSYPYSDPLFYPLPACLFVLPLLPINAVSATLAGAIFFGLVSGLLAYALTADAEGYARLPVFLSSSFLVSATMAQWSPLLLAAIFLPWLRPLGIAKPNLLAGAISRTGIDRWLIAGTAAIMLASVVILPSWPLDWLHNLGSQHHVPAILTLPGFALIPAIFFFRNRDARFLLVLAIIPQLLFWYDQLLLWAIPRTLRQSVFLSAASWVGYLAWSVQYRHASLGARVEGAAPWVVVGTFVPALGIVLYQEWVARKQAQDSPAAVYTVSDDEVWSAA